MNKKIEELKESLHHSTAEKSPEELKKTLYNNPKNIEGSEEEEEEIGDLPLVGFKIRKYLIVGCSYCNEDYEIQWNACKEHLMKTKGNTQVRAICPWCGYETTVDVFTPYNEFRCESVKNS